MLSKLYMEAEVVMTPFLTGFACALTIPLSGLRKYFHE